MTRRFSLAVSLYLFGALCTAQAAGLQGDVVDAKGAPLANAVVTLHGASAPSAAAPGKAVHSAPNRYRDTAREKRLVMGARQGSLSRTARPHMRLFADKEGLQED